jgi:hypothetical protein
MKEPSHSLPGSTTRTGRSSRRGQTEASTGRLLCTSCEQILEVFFQHSQILTFEGTKERNLTGIVFLQMSQEKD